MRIACLHLPSFPLQIHARLSPHLSGKAFAVTDLGERKAIVACSRAAYAAGVRPQMTATQARALAPETQLIPAELELYRHALVALAEGLLAHSVTVDIGGQYQDDLLPAHASLYLEVPTKKRAQRFGEDLLTHILASGYRARAGVADDRFTAWAAALTGKTSSLATTQSPLFAQTCRVVARGGSAAYLAPLPLNLLPLADSLREILATLGITTLGEFAALPPPTVGRRWTRGGVDYQQLASGLGRATLCNFTPTETIVEHIELEHEVTEIEPLTFVLRPLAERACKRLKGRGLAATKATLMLIGANRDRDITEIEIEPSRPTLSSQTLASLARAQLVELKPGHPIFEVGLLVNQTSEPEIEELDLFDYRDAAASPDAVDIAVARLRAAFGDEAVGAAELVDSYRPETAFRLTPFTPATKKRKKAKRKGSARKKTIRAKATATTAVSPMIMNGTTGALRLIDPPAPQPHGLETVRIDGPGGHETEVISSRGPTRVEAEWWSGDPLERDYYEVETKDGGRYWVFREKSGAVYLHGIFD